VPHRRIVDSQGTPWEVWDVNPQLVERRQEADRRRDPRPTPDRRQSTEPRLRMGGPLAMGWLAFQNEGETRRLAPIPDDWYRLPDPELEDLCLRAAPVPKTDRPRDD
jgi:hypothetical protein